MSTFERAPLWGINYQAIRPGTCVLSDGDFAVTIVVVPLGAASLAGVN